MSHAQIVLCSAQTDSFTFHSICLSFLYSDSLTCQGTPLCLFSKLSGFCHVSGMLPAQKCAGSAVHQKLVRMTSPYTVY